MSTTKTNKLKFLFFTGFDEFLIQIRIRKSLDPPNAIHPQRTVQIWKKIQKRHETNNFLPEGF